MLALTLAAALALGGARLAPTPTRAPAVVALPARAQPPPLVAAPAAPLPLGAAEAALRARRADARAPPLVDARQLAPEVSAALVGAGTDFAVPETGTDAARAFCAHPTPRFIGGALCALAGARLAAGGAPGAAELLALAASAPVWWAQEWLIHDKLLHSRFDWFGERTHRWHHELPYYHACIDPLPLAAAWFGGLLGAVLGVGVGLLHALPLRGGLAFAFGYTAWGLAYELCHYLAHTKVPLRGHLCSVRTHHMRHHVHSDEYWLAFTLPLIDDLAGTRPRRPADVPRKAAPGSVGRGARRRAPPPPPQ